MEFVQVENSTFLICNRQQRNVQRSITRVHRLFCSLNLLFADVFVDVVFVLVCVSSLISVGERKHCTGLI